MSETPETDRKCLENPSPIREVVCADFARKLERERDKAQELADDQYERAKNYFNERNKAELRIAILEQDIALIRKIIKKGGTAQDVMKFLDRPEA
jgi:hypothetical protein